MEITDAIILSIIGIAILALSKGVYEQRQNDSTISERNTNSFGGKRKTKKIKY
jgi:hypothetical protein